MDEETPFQGVLLKGLPFSSTKSAIQQFFKNIDVRDDQITVIAFSNNRPTGLGFIQMREEDIPKALLNDRNHMNDRYIEVFPSNEIELYELLMIARDKHAEPREIFKLAGRKGSKRRDRSPTRKSLSTKYAYFSGVPKGMTYRHMREFFKGCLIGHDCIHLLREEGGSFRGDGFVEFGNSGECVKGLRMNGSIEKDSVILVEPCRFDEMSKVVKKINGSEIQSKSEDLRATLSSKRGSSRRERRHTPSPVRKRLKAYAATYRASEHEEYVVPYDKSGMGYQQSESPIYHDDRRRSKRTEHEEQRQWPREEQFREAPQRSSSGYNPYDDHHRGSDDHHRGSDDRHRVSGGHPRESDNHHRGSDDHHRGSDDHHRGSDDHHRESDGRPRGSDNRPRESNYSLPEPSQRPSYSREYVQQPQYVQPQYSDNGHPGSAKYSPSPSAPERKMLRLEGLPYEATVRDIMQFFEMYSLQYEQIRIQCRDDGSPSGKAFVVFSSEKFARAAMDTHDKTYINGRYVEMFLV